MCMKRNVVSRETGLPARMQPIENKTERLLARAGRRLLPYDVYDGKGVGCERGVPEPADGFVDSSLSRGYILASHRPRNCGVNGECRLSVYAGERQTEATGSFQDTGEPSQGWHGDPGDGHSRARRPCHWGIRRAAVLCVVTTHRLDEKERKCVSVVTLMSRLTDFQLDFQLGLDKGIGK